MSRPIDEDGTLSCSIGTFEKAAALGTPPAAPKRPGNSAAPIAATVNPRNQPPDLTPPKAIAASPWPIPRPKRDITTSRGGFRQIRQVGGAPSVQGRDYLR